MDRIRLIDFPFTLFLFSFIVLWLCGRIGARFRSMKVHDPAHGDTGLILAATLTLLGLIVGFTFSMATNRYEQRKNYEEAEANAIGTEYVRADLLPAADAQKVRALLVNYTNQRLLFYQAQTAQQLLRVSSDTGQVQAELWSAVLGPAYSKPSPLTALVISGMNDVLNSQGYTQAAWWNRIPAAAWALMIIIAICCNLLIGYSIPVTRPESVVFLALTFVVALSFFLIADIDSPRGGLIRVHPQNLISLSQSFHPQ